MLVAPPADPEVEDREPEVEELEQALDDLIGFARDPSIGIVGRRAADPNAHVVRVVERVAGRDRRARPLVATSSICTRSTAGTAGPIDGIHRPATRPVSSSAFARRSRARSGCGGRGLEQRRLAVPRTAWYGEGRLGPNAAGELLVHLAPTRRTSTRRSTRRRRRGERGRGAGRRVRLRRELEEELGGRGRRGDVPVPAPVDGPAATSAAASTTWSGTARSCGSRARSCGGRSCRSTRSTR